MVVGTIRFHLHLPGCSSLKEKRSRIVPLISRLHREFNVSAAELELQDKWQETVICCAMLGNERRHLEAALQAVSRWLAANWPDGDVIEEKVEII